MFLTRKLLVICLVFFSGCQISRSVAGLNGETISGADYDTVLRVVPVSVKPLGVTRTFDAIESGDEAIELFDKKVVFEIDEVLLGEYVKIKRGGPSKFEQMKESTEEKDFMKVLTLDYKDPEEEIDKKWISVAVKDPDKRFGIVDWNNPKKRKIKLYLQTTKANKDTYILKGVADA